MIHRGKPGLLSMVAGLLTACLLAGCGGQTGSSGGVSPAADSSSNAQAAAVTGGYVEDILAQSDGGFTYDSLIPRGDGSLLAVGYDREAQCPAAQTSADGGQSWQAVDNTGAAALVKEVNPNGFDIVTGTVAEDGTWWVGHSVLNYDDYGMTEPETEEKTTEDAEKDPFALYRVAPGGQAEKWDVPYITEKNNDPNLYLNAVRILQSESGRVVVILYDSMSYDLYHIVVLDSEGRQENAFTLDAKTRIYRSLIHEENLYALDPDGEMHVYELATGKQVESFPTPLADETGMESVLYDIEEDGSLVYLDSLGLHRLARGGSMVQNLAEGMQYAFSDISFYPKAFLALPDGEYLAAIGDMNSGEEALYRYRFDTTLDISTEGQILIWAMEESTVLRAAASAFAKQNPGIPIQIEYGRQEGGATDEDIIRALNTRLLADDAPDVLVLDGLPVDSYIASGMLENLTGLIDTTGCYANIMDCYVRDGSAYGYPVLFSLPSFWARAGDGMEGKINTLDDLAALAEADPDNLVYGGWGSLFDAYYASYSPLIFPGAASVDQEALTEFLNATARIAAALPITMEEDYSHGGVGISEKLPIQGVAAYIEGMYGGPTGYCADIVRSVEDGWQQFAAGGEQYIQPMPGKGYIPVCGVGIPTGAAQKESAAAFIQIMLDDPGVQFTSMEDGFPVRQSVLEDYFSRDFSGLDPVALPGGYDWAALIAQYEQPAVTELLLREKVWEQAQKLYEGSLSLDSAVEAVMQNTKTYFAERAV